MRVYKKIGIKMVDIKLVQKWFRNIRKVFKKYSSFVTHGVVQNIGPLFDVNLNMKLKNCYKYIGN